MCNVIKVINLLIFSFLALWTVINEGSNQVRLHNNFNYLAIVNGQTMVIHKVRADYFNVLLDFKSYLQFNWVYPVILIN